MPAILILEAIPVNWTDPVKLPAVPVVGGVVLDAAIALQLPKGDPACNFH